MLAALHDPILVVVSLAAVLGLVLAARAGGARGVPPLALRKSLHVAVGLWTVFITPLFHHLAWALVPPLVFLGANASGKTSQWAPSVAEAGSAASRRGLWTFPLGVAIAYLLFWQAPGRAPILAGCAVLALADPVAAMVGRRWGQRRLHPIGHARTLEGSLAFFLVAAIVIGWIAAWRTPGAFPLRLSVGAGSIGAAAEAVAPPGWDNLIVPLAVAVAYHWLA
ncbi:MAG TPA: hypothetical protein VF363_06265 [Candidatus Eisenbacteria bacterium]